MTSESGLDNYIHLKYDKKVWVTKESHICKCINTANKKNHKRVTCTIYCTLNMLRDTISFSKFSAGERYWRLQFVHWTRNTGTVTAEIYPPLPSQLGLPLSAALGIQGVSPNFHDCSVLGLSCCDCQKIIVTVMCWGQIPRQSEVALF